MAIHYVHQDVSFPSTDVDWKSPCPKTGVDSAITKLELGIAFEDFTIFSVLFVEGQDHAVHGDVPIVGSLASTVEDGFGQDLVLLCEQDGLVVDNWNRKSDIVGGFVVVGSVQMVEPVFLVNR